MLAELFGTQLYADWTQQLKDQLTAAEDASHDSQKQMEQLMTSIEELADQTDPVQWLQAAATLLKQHEQQLAQQVEAAVAAQAKAKKLDEQFHVEQICRPPMMSWPRTKPFNNSWISSNQQSKLSSS